MSISTEVLQITKQSNPTIISLDLSEQNILDADIEILYHALKNNPYITALYLANNAIGITGAHQLAKITSLKILNISSNQLGDDGECALEQHQTLLSLDISANHITRRGAIALAKNKKLTDLNISVNDIRDDGAQALAQHPHIVTLDVSGNNIGPQGAIAWAANTTFTTIDIWSEQLLEATIKAFIANTTLKSFFMYLNPTPVDIYGLLLARLEQASSTFKRVQLQKPVDLIDDLSWLILTHIKLNRHEMMLELCLLTLKENPFPLPCEIIKKHIAPFLIPQRLGEHLFHGLNKRS